MKKKTIKFFNLKRKKDGHFGWGYEGEFADYFWVKDVDAFRYKLLSLERYFKNMGEVLEKEEKTNSSPNLYNGERCP